MYPHQELECTSISIEYSYMQSPRDKLCPAPSTRSRDRLTREQPLMRPTGQVEVLGRRVGCQQRRREIRRIPLAGHSVRICLDGMLARDHKERSKCNLVNEHLVSCPQFEPHYEVIVLFYRVRRSFGAPKGPEPCWTWALGRLCSGFGNVFDCELADAGVCGSWPRRQRSICDGVYRIGESARWNRHPLELEGTRVRTRQM